MSQSSPSSSSASSSDSESGRPTKSLKRKIDASEAVDDSDSSSNSDDSEAELDETAKARPKDSKKTTSTGGNDEDGVEEDAEVDVLSHAAKRRQKKRQKLELEQNPSSSNANSKSTKSKDKSAKAKNGESAVGDDKTKRQNSVWVGNMSFKTAPESLRSFFDGVGEITRVHMPMKLATGGADKQKGKWPAAAKENRGFAYVDFASPDAKILAISYSEKNLDGRRLLIKDGDDFTGRPAATPSTDTAEGSSKGPSSNLAGHSKTAQKILSVQKQPPGPTLFLGNLGFETTTEQITEMITAHYRAAADKSGGKKEKKEELDEDDTEPGKGQVDGAKKEKNEAGIRKVRMGTFEDSGLCKGFAFVDFISAEHATAVLINPRNHKLNGRQLVVEYASPDAVRRGGHREKGAGPPKGQKKFVKGEGRRHNDNGDGDANRDGQGQAKGDADKEVDNSFKGRRNERGSKDGFTKRRPKPGAALALAKRENVAIVPSEGTRITF